MEAVEFLGAVVEGWLYLMILSFFAALGVAAAFAITDLDKRHGT